MFQIYLVTNAINGKVYVGLTKQGMEKRWRKHVNDSTKKPYYFSYAIAKHGAENFKLEEIDRTDTLEHANELEKHYIKLYKSCEPSFGYNGTYGGDGVPNTPASLEKLKKAMTGMPRPESARQKLSEQMQGAGNHMYGKPVSEETRQKRSAKLKGRPRPKEVMERIVKTRELNKFLKTIAWG